MHTDIELLSRYHQRGDALAFRDLMQSHAGMVFATARRVTRDALMAEDVAQETFVQLARHSQHVSESVAAWLHRVAWRRACNAVRDQAKRREMEEASVEQAVAADNGGASSWHEVEAVLDAVIDELPAQQRAPLVMHFLENKSQREIAKQLGVSQSTVSRSVEAGLAELRSRMKSRGVLCGVGLGVMMAHAAAAAQAPATLMTSLSKLGMSGIGGGSAAATGAAVISVAAALKLVLAASLAFVAGGMAKHASEAHKMAMVAQGAPPPAAAQARVDAPPKKPRVQRVLIPIASRAGAVAAATPATAALKGPVPVHELVHSFPLPPRRPRGHMVLDKEGWLWGTATSGGDYGLGVIYKMRADGRDWQAMVAFNGIAGRPRGAYPQDGLMRTADGALWGTTSVGGPKNQGTLFRYDPASGDFETMFEFDEAGQPWSVPVVAPDGQLWGTTHYTVYRFNPATRQMITVFRGSGKRGAHPGTQLLGGLTADGKGFFWGTAERGGASDLGVVFKVSIATGEAATVVEFTGRQGAMPGAAPMTALTLHDDGCLWGTTSTGGAQDKGTVFKIDPATCTWVAVAEFSSREGGDTGSYPQTQLAMDGQGSLWGTTTNGGDKGFGTVFKIHARSHALVPVVHFTGIEGEVRGGPARGHLLNDGAGGLIGACDAGGHLATLYRVDTKTGGYTQLVDISEIQKPVEGHDLQGSLIAGTGDWLWGMAAGGSHRYGVVYKFNTVTNELVNVVEFTGLTGPCKGRVDGAGLVNDGQGFIWGVTSRGGASDRGTIFKIEERTGAFTTVAESRQPSENRLASFPASALVPDGLGFLWGTNFWTVYKVEMKSGEVSTVVTFKGDKGPLYGSGGLGGLALDDQGFLWGCSQTDDQQKRACLFKIDTRTGAFTSLAEFTDANSSFWRSRADMFFDGRGSMWFSGVIDGGGKYAENTLFKVDTRTGTITGRYRSPDFVMIGTPVMDACGLLWGGALNGGYVRDGEVYAFDPATGRFSTVMTFTGQGSQARSGHQPQHAALYKHRDGNFYGITRVGGPGNGGTVFRLRFGPTPMTQEATLLAEGGAVLHGTLTPNGLDSQASFEWGTDPSLEHATVLDAGRVAAGEAVKPVTAALAGLKPATTYYFRACGRNAANPAPQHGAVLHFTTPEAGATASAGALAATGKAGAQGTTAAASGSASVPRYALAVNRIPGAGAGLVSGALAGKAYEIGWRCTLTALADNGYIFHHWSGPGIGGARAEHPVLSFVFTPELARSPVITATFVRDPFTEDAVGAFSGLIYAAGGTAPDVTNTGSVRLRVTRTGAFTGSLRYDGGEMAVAGAFDAGGLARFGPGGVSTLVLQRKGKPGLLLALQMDLSPSGPHQVTGTLGTAAAAGITARSTLIALRGGWNGFQHPMPAKYLAEGGHHAFTIRDLDGKGAGQGLMVIGSDGSASLAARLGDGSGVLTQAPLSDTGLAALFVQLYQKRSGAFGGLLTLDTFLAGEPADQPFWWCRPAIPWQDLNVRRRQGGEAE